MQSSPTTEKKTFVQTELTEPLSVAATTTSASASDPSEATVTVRPPEELKSHMPRQGEDGTGGGATDISGREMEAAEAEVRIGCPLSRDAFEGRNLLLRCVTQESRFADKVVMQFLDLLSAKELQLLARELKVRRGSQAGLDVLVEPKQAAAKKLLGVGSSDDTYIEAKKEISQKMVLRLNRDKENFLNFVSQVLEADHSTYQKFVNAVTTKGEFAELRERIDLQDKSSHRVTHKGILGLSVPVFTQCTVGSGNYSDPIPGQNVGDLVQCLLPATKRLPPAAGLVRQTSNPMEGDKTYYPPAVQVTFEIADQDGRLVKTELLHGVQVSDTSESFDKAVEKYLDKEESTRQFCQHLISLETIHKALSIATQHLRYQLDTNTNHAAEERDSYIVRVVKVDDDRVLVCCERKFSQFAKLGKITKKWKCKYGNGSLKLAVMFKKSGICLHPCWVDIKYHDDVNTVPLERKSLEASVKANGKRESTTVRWSSELSLASLSATKTAQSKEEFSRVKPVKTGQWLVCTDMDLLGKISLMETNMNLFLDGWEKKINAAEFSARSGEVDFRRTLNTGKIFKSIDPDDDKDFVMLKSDHKDIDPGLIRRSLSTQLKSAKTRRRDLTNRCKLVYSKFDQDDTAPLKVDASLFEDGEQGLLKKLIAFYDESRVWHKATNKDLLKRMQSDLHSMSNEEIKSELEWCRSTYHQSYEVLHPFRGDPMFSKDEDGKEITIIGEGVDIKGKLHFHERTDDPEVNKKRASREKAFQLFSQQTFVYNNAFSRFRRQYETALKNEFDARGAASQKPVQPVQV
ncbi:hypothetical protein M3P05_19620 [Sansalvadorimonas sp. 2012CJ34-2]|uniref:Uncharacterized protein n=1 Tax=Parendozoicomonas callyspongiae TaxID=2942213 RepID=A0ABT0PL89_9GAMM|nr:hypothetical protein [Sansalvadorimonas sp. 2012CJ34-2]MCL6272133.1 hypothetical protein [Sansalvadorimonas sp. 2012CJ34-2]